MEGSSVTRRPASSVLLGVLTALVLATNVSAAPNWTAAQDIRVKNLLTLNDADFSDMNVAITWDEPRNGQRRVALRTSVDAGSAFGPISFFGVSRQSAVDICGGAELNAVMAHQIAPDNWFIEHAVGSVDGDSFLTTPVSPTDGIQSFPDVACAGGRVFVSWFEAQGGGGRLFVAHARRTVMGFSDPIDLGFDNETASDRSLAVAGSDNTAYVVFHRSDGVLRFKRWTIGGGPNFPVNLHPTQIVAQGTINDPASDAMIAASGNKVAVAWFRCHWLYARVSNDSGQTFGPVRRLVNHGACQGDSAAKPRSIAINGDQIAFTYAFASIGSVSYVSLIRTNNDFASFSNVKIANGYPVVYPVGYVTVAGVPKLAAAFQKQDVLRFRRQV
jgi:hypothetical protein